MRAIQTILLCVLCYMANAQAIVIQSLQPLITEGDSCNVSLICKVRIGYSGCSKIGIETNINSDTIFLNVCYNSGGASALCTRIDTFCIGNLPAINYVAVFTASHTKNGLDCDITNWRDTAFTTLQMGPVGIQQIGGDEIGATLHSYSSLHLSSPYAGAVGIQVYNAIGQLHHSSNTQVSEGKNDITLDIPNLSSGLYLYHIQLGVQRKVLKYMHK